MSNPQTSKSISPVVRLRSTSTTLSLDQVRATLIYQDFVDKSWNHKGRGLKHHYNVVVGNGKKLVKDDSTGLTWQQSGSTDMKNHGQMKDYIFDLNKQKYGGYSDWRLPTLEEAMSLMEQEKSTHALFIDPIFDGKQFWVWTSDQQSDTEVWAVHFGTGSCSYIANPSKYYGRAVRSEK